MENFLENIDFDAYRYQEIESAIRSNFVMPYDEAKMAIYVANRFIQSFYMSDGTAYPLSKMMKSFIAQEDSFIAEFLTKNELVVYFATYVMIAVNAPITWAERGFLNDIIGRLHGHADYPMERRHIVEEIKRYEEQNGKASFPIRDEFVRRLAIISDSKNDILSTLAHSINQLKQDKVLDYLEDNVNWRELNDEIIVPSNVNKFIKSILDIQSRLDIINFLLKYEDLYFRDVLSDPQNSYDLPYIIYSKGDFHNELRALLEQTYGRLERMEKRGVELQHDQQQESKDVEQPATSPVGVLPKELNNPQILEYLNKLKDAEVLDDKYLPIQLTSGEVSYIAHCIGDALKLRKYYPLFESFWSMKALAVAHTKFLKNEKYSKFAQQLKDIFPVK